MTVMLVNITGPDGKTVAAGQEVPSSWDAAYVRSLVDEGAAGPKKEWDARVERNRIEAEARAGEPPLPQWGQAEQQAHREHAALVAQLEAVKALGVDVSAVELPPEPPPPPNVPAAVVDASRALLDATGPEVERAAKRLRQAAAAAEPAPGVQAIAKARHALAGTLRGEQR